MKKMATLTLTNFNAKSEASSSRKTSSRNSSKSCVKRTSSIKVNEICSMKNWSQRVDNFINLHRSVNRMPRRCSCSNRYLLSTSMRWQISRTISRWGVKKTWTKSRGTYSKEKLSCSKNWKKKCPVSLSTWKLTHSSSPWKTNWSARFSWKKSS